MFYRTDDLRIRSTKVVLPPVFLEEELPVTEAASATVFHARKEIAEILNQRNHRLLVVAGQAGAMVTNPIQKQVLIEAGYAPEAVDALLASGAAGQGSAPIKP